MLFYSTDILSFQKAYSVISVECGQPMIGQRYTYLSMNFPCTHRGALGMSNLSFLIALSMSDGDNLKRLIAAAK